MMCVIAIVKYNKPEVSKYEMCTHCMYGTKRQMGDEVTKSFIMRVAYTFGLILISSCFLLIALVSLVLDM